MVISNNQNKLVQAPPGDFSPTWRPWLEILATSLLNSIANGVSMIRQSRLTNYLTSVYYEIIIQIHWTPVIYPNI
jgi:hypothetical protein